MDGVDSATEAGIQDSPDQGDDGDFGKRLTASCHEIQFQLSGIRRRTDKALNERTQPGDQQQPMPMLVGTIF